MASVRWICVLFILIMIFATGLQYETKVLKSGDDLDLTCEDESPIYWCHPGNYTPSEANGYDAYTVTTHSQGTKYTTTLKIQKAIYIYTGYYHCVRNNTESPCTRQMENVVKSTYIYIEDPNHLFVVEEPFMVIYAYLGENAKLLCLPTNPNIDVTLSKGGGEMALGKQKRSELTLSYDRTLGYNLGPFTTRDSDDYYCEANWKGKTEILTYDIRTKARPSFLMPPTIRRNNTIEKHTIVREGGNLTLECESLQKRETAFSMDWVPPNQVNQVKHFEKCAHSNYLCKKLLLTVINVTLAAGGNYSCVVSAPRLHSEQAIVEVEVIGKDMKGITLNSTWNSSKPVLKEINPMKIVVDYKAPGKIDIKWYDPENRPIMNSRKYRVENTNTQTILKVYNISVHDAGSYKLNISDQTGFETFESLAIIQDKPEINISSPHTLFHKNMEVNFSCIVYSPAPVDVKWIYCSQQEIQHCVGSKGSSVIKTERFENFNREYVLNIKHKIQGGVLQCVANNTCTKTSKNYCGTTNSSINLYLTELEDLRNPLIIYNKPDEFIAGTEIVLTCAANAFNFEGYPLWYMGDEVKPMANSSDFFISTSKSQYTYFTNLTIQNASRQLNKIKDFSCHGYNSSSIDTVAMYVEEPEKPVIYDTNVNKEIKVKLSEGTTLYCKSKGKPKPKTEWYRNNIRLLKEPGIVIKDQSLIIFSALADHKGEYSCIARSSSGQAIKKATLVVTGTPGPISLPLLITLLILGPLLLALVIFLILKIRKERKLQRELNLAGLANFEKGALENINPELPVDEQAELLPYDKTWEFPEDRLKLGKLLGAGAFGVVMKAEAYSILEEEEKTTVAVKMVKSGADLSYIKALASELKIMTHLGKHLNVVNLLGASTKKLAKKELMVIVEFCRFGNLHNYLIRHRHHFVDQLDRTTGEINISIGMEKLTRSQSTKSKTNLKQRLLSYSSSLVGTSITGGSNSENRAPSSPSPTEIIDIASDMSVVSSPSGEPDECLLSNGSADQPQWRVKYAGDYKDMKDFPINVCTQNILCWAFQIARGMEYLASRKVLHGDLAARNVLLADDNIVKICDFGLARSMYKSDNYKKKGGGPLPVKWMALESIRDRVYSTQSDVWSFGIVLWELFSLARTPYPGMEANERLLEKLQNGYRMERPSYAPHAVYQTMLKCWEETPNKRPTFTELAEELGAMLDENLRRHFEELDNHYVDMNDQRKTNGDYLNMMCAPNYNNLMTPTRTEEEYISSHASASDQRYLNMSPMSPLSDNGSVFEFEPENAAASGYLRMSAKDNIFSPRHIDENPFKFAPSTPKETRIEMESLKTNADNYVNIGSSISNPGYIMGQPVQTDI